MSDIKRLDVILELIATVGHAAMGATMALLNTPRGRPRFPGPAGT